MKTDQPPGSSRSPLGLCVGLLLLSLAILFWRALLPEYVVFSNDGPLGAMVATQNRLPAILTGMWMDLNWIGGPYPAPAMMLSTAFRLATTPLILSKLYAPFSLFVVGLCAWICFRQYKFSQLACLLAALAAALNSDFFNTASWGVCSQPVAFGMEFLALAALADNTSRRRWLRVALAGFCVGLGVMEAYDIGALFSLIVAAFVLVQSFVSEGPVGKRIFQGIGRLALVGGCAGLIAAATLATLASTQIKGVAGVEQDAESKAARWSFATQYSIPKLEALGIIVPGVFGFRHDTPGGGEYWGRAGSDPSWDEFVSSGGTSGHPGGAFRAGAGSTYAGVLVMLLAFYGVSQSLRKQDGPFTSAERKLVWFWVVVVVVALLLMFGRFAPFYQFFYALPYVSTIRNPAKFLHIAEWALIILFAYGAEALWRAGFAATPGSANSLVSHWQSWWARARGFDRRWVIGSLLGLGVFGGVWLIYTASRGALEGHIAELTTLQYAAMGQKPDAAAAAEAAKATASFSIGQVGRTLLYLLPAVGLVALTVSGYFRGRRARIGSVLFVVLLLADLLPVNRPWVVFVNWKVKYETNPVIEFLRERPYEHRVAIFPLDRFIDLRRLPREMMPLVQQYSFFAQLYGIEWTQHLFQYYDIQSLDIVQEPRVAQDKAAYEAVLAFAPPLRRWELSNTRYLLGPAAFVESLNQQLDPGKGRFRIATRFDLAAKPGVDTSLPQLEQVTTVINTNGALTVFDFTGALPRAKLYANWKVSTNDPALLRDWVKGIAQRVPQEMRSSLTAQSLTDLATLHELADKAFDPAQTVLLAEPLAAALGTNQNPGEVKFVSYAPRHIVLAASAKAPCVMLLNDKYDPNWHVWVDGKPAELLRCNFIARGVFLDQAGEHRVEFRYQPPLIGFYVSLASVLVASSLLGFVWLGRKAPPTR
jgi:hypothetical protein